MLQELISLHLQSATRTVLVVLTLRSLPVVVTISASETCRAIERAAVVGAYTLLGCLALRYANYDVIGMMTAYVYLAAVAVVPYAMSRRVRRRSVLSLTALGVFMLIPAAFALKYRLVALVLGWEFMLASYSYCASATGSLSFADYASFVLVNPALVYGHRGQMVSGVGFDGRGFLRFLQGAGLMFLSEMVPLLRQLVARSAWQHGTAALSGIVAILGIYAAHTGLASIRIGLCRQLGMAIPERYLRPFSATSPADFWRRWNTYVGTWIRIYVFQPISRQARKKLGLRGASLQAFAILVSFASIGLLHDLYGSLNDHELKHWGCVWFTMNGVILVAWESIARVLGGRVSSVHWRQAGGRALVVAIAIVMVAAAP